MIKKWTLIRERWSFSITETIALAVIGAGFLFITVPPFFFPWQGPSSKMQADAVAKLVMIGVGLLVGGVLMVALSGPSKDPGEKS